MAKHLGALFTAAVVLAVQMVASAQTPGGSRTARPLITQPIDGARLITLAGNVRRDLTPERDLGLVEDTLPLRLYLVLQRSPERQADLDNLIARQQQPTAAEYHKWLTPQEFGERFGASQEDIAKISTWLEAQGMHVNGVLNNAIFIDFTATAGQVRATFHAETHYYNMQGGKYPANAQDPQIPAALEHVVAGIKGLSKIPVRSHRTPGRPVSYDAQTHTWHDTEPTMAEWALPKYFAASSGNFDVTPQDFYTIYNVNPIFKTGNLGAGATIGLPEPTDMEYGSVNPTTGAATGGDVATFRKLFGVPGTLNMTVLHGAGTVTCADPGIGSAVGEAALDAEWANAIAPSAHLIFLSCDDTSVGDGFTTALTALIDNNISDVISSSYGNSEAVISASDFTADDALASQAAAQGQSFLDAAGDAGSADADQNTTTTATHGFNVDQYAGHPLVTAVGGNDFSDLYDANQGGEPQSTYWGATNSQYYEDALGYIPETPWNSSCASSLLAINAGYSSGADFCAAGPSGGDVDGSVVGGGGGFSAHYAQPSYQPGTLGLSANASKRAVPDISFFAANGTWGHNLIQCDSSSASTACTSSSTFEEAGGTSFTAPQFAGVTALLVTVTGERQGTLNPALYALAKAQFGAAATATSCYSNGQTANTGVTTGLPVAACIFHDITTSNNDEPCKVGSLDCFVNPGATYGLLSTSGSASLKVAFPSGIGYDNATGLGSVNIYNLITKWNTAYTSSTELKAAPTSITSSQSTDLTATVTGGTPKGYTGTNPALTGSVSFAAGSTALGSCTLSAGTCSKTVNGSALEAGANSITATFSGSGTYPASTSSIVTVTITSSTVSVPAQVTATPFVYNRATKTFDSTYTIKNVSAASYAGPIELVLTKLSAGVTVANATGTYNGSPYLAVSATALAAGASVSVAVRFSDPTNVAISPTPVVYSGAL
jgi:subtilase family serine protease